MSKFQGVLKMFMLGILKTISKTMLKYEKNTITLYGTCWNWAADFVFLLRFCTRKRSETYRNWLYKDVCSKTINNQHHACIQVGFACWVKKFLLIQFCHYTLKPRKTYHPQFRHMLLQKIAYPPEKMQIHYDYDITKTKLKHPEKNMVINGKNIMCFLITKCSLHTCLCGELIIWPWVLKIELCGQSSVGNRSYDQINITQYCSNKWSTRLLV